MGRSAGFRRERCARWAATAAVLAGAFTAAPASAAEPLDCTGPAGDPAPGTAAWHEREVQSAWCATQRMVDTHANPLYLTAQANRAPARATAAMDPAREPTVHAGSRFRFDELSITDAGGTQYPVFLFRPCDASCTGMPAGLEAHQAPYPGVVIMHGGAANHEMYLWAAEGLAEAGYMVVTVNIGRTERNHYEAVKAGLDWLFSTPADQFADGGHNPHWQELDRERGAGLAGHSAGGVAVSRLGQEDPRVGAIVSWDRAQSGPMPAGLPIRTPAIFFTADYNCQQVPVCLPQPYGTPPDPLGPGNKDEDFRRVRDAGVDAMKVALRSAVHLDWTEWPELNASRYGAVTTLYYTLAWLDRYVRGDPGATQRLTAATFDDSADVHNISTGRWDPATLRNVPAQIAGQPVGQRLSFHFRSGYWLEGGAAACEDMRGGCDQVTPGL